MIFHLILERLSRRELPRVLEPDLVMTDPAQVAAFGESGAEDGHMAFLYVFHAVQCLPVMRPGDRVLDLACGPANQLAVLAEINPGASFIGLDASARMLECAQATLARRGLSNVELRRDDMTRLDSVSDASVDAVVCTLSLHHLPDTAALAITMQAVRRVLKPRGGIYFADFGRLKRVATQRFFAEDRRERQTSQFTLDFFQSQQAAFSVAELLQAVALLEHDLALFQTALAPFMVILRSQRRDEIDTGRHLRAQKLYRQLSSEQRRDFHNFTRWFRFAGLGLPCPLE